MNSQPYVPGLRWKRAEMASLQRVDQCDIAHIFPLIELAPREYLPGASQTAEQAEVRARRFRSELRDVWNGRPSFVCTGLIGEAYRLSDGRSLLETVLDASDRMTLNIVPVVSADPNDPRIPVVRTSSSQSAAIRAPAALLLRPGAEAVLDRVSAHMGLDRSSVHVIVDLGYVTAVDGRYQRVAGLAWLGSFASVTLLGGSFPVDLTGMAVGRRILPRHEWSSWSSVGGNHALGFGDWTIQHPIYRQLSTVRPNYSASIRYTSDETWLVMRGEGVFNDGGPGFSQWPANALILTMQPEFLGADFSYGDSYIWQTANQTAKTGSAETWLRAGISHHLALVARQVSGGRAA